VAFLTSSLRTFRRDVPQIVERARQVMEARMRGRVRIERPAGELVTDPATHEVTREVTPVWEGRAYARYPGVLFESTAQVGGLTIVASRLMIRVPLGVPAEPGDIVTVLKDPDTPALNGKAFQVASVDFQSQGAALRILLKDLQIGAV
jgi:hypothetical protein